MKLLKFLTGGKYVDVPLWSLDPMKKNEVNNYMQSQGINPSSLSKMYAFTDAPESMLAGGLFESNDAKPVMNFFKHNIPGFREAYNAKASKSYPNGKEEITYKTPPFVPTLNLPGVIIASKKLPGIQVTAPDLSKPQEFPYGSINVTNKPNRSVYINPFDKSYLASSYENGGVVKAQEGLLFGGSNKGNRFVSEPYPQQLPAVTVNSSKPYRFDRRSLDLGNGYGVISDVLFKSYENGKYLGDLSPIMAGRTIYLTPAGNDTVYSGYTQGWGGNSKWIEYDEGLMPIMKGSPNGKATFYLTLKKSFVRPGNKEESAAFLRAKRGYQQGGLIEKQDNTRVASGRPQLIKNKIPYGAGKGPAADSPMRLFNDPYINMGLMAMAPMAVKIQSKNVLAPAQSVKYPPVSTNLTYGLLRLYRAAQLKGYKGTIEDFITLSSEILGTPQVMGSEGNKFYGYNLERGNNILYSRPNPENPKVEGLTVNEPARWQELLKKIIK